MKDTPYKALIRGHKSAYMKVVKVTTKPKNLPIPIKEKVKVMAFDVKGLYLRICTILETRFIFYEHVAQVMSIALAKRKNAWFHGPGGYGKSEMVEAVIAGLGLMDDTFIQAFGQGMTPDKILGDIDLKEMRQNDRLRYKTEESFINKKYAVFEELPDAALPVLFILKDPLARKKLRYGSQQEQLLTESIFVCSNRGPSYLADYGVDAAALAQRFPYQKNVCWDKHDQGSYEKLLHKRAPSMEGPTLESQVGAYSQLLADASARGEPISPRIALDGAQALQAVAAINGRQQVTANDFAVLQYVSGLEILGEAVEKKAVEAAKRAAVEINVRNIEHGLAKLVGAVQTINSTERAFQLSRELRRYIELKVTPLVVDDEGAARKQLMVDMAHVQVGECYKRGELFAKELVLNA